MQYGAPLYGGGLYGVICMVGLLYGALLYDWSMYGVGPGPLNSAPLYGGRPCMKPPVWCGTCTESHVWCSGLFGAPLYVPHCLMWGPHIGPHCMVRVDGLYRARLYGGVPVRSPRYGTPLYGDPLWTDTRENITSIYPYECGR